MKKITSLISMSVLSLGLVASAQTFSLTQHNQGAENSLELKGRITNAAVQAENFSLATQAKKAVKRVAQEAEVTEIGTVVTPYVLTEDFSLMGGSPEAPQYDADLLYDMYAGEVDNAWETLKPGFTHQQGWGCNNSYPAGGYFLMDVAKGGGYANINTPMLDITGHDGVATIRVRAKTMGGETPVTIEHAETNHMGPTWTNVVGTDVIIGEEWGVYEFTVQNGGPSAIFNIVVMQMTDIPVNVLVDEISVIQYDLHVGIPTLNPHTNYQGESFDLSWSAVEGADSYLVDLYYLIPGDHWAGLPDEIVYVYQEEPVATNSWTVTGVENGQTYYYTVRAVKGEYKSLAPDPVVIFDLVNTEMTSTSAISENGVYTAEWTEVPSAEVYNYWAYCDRVAAEDGLFVVTEEDFTGVVGADGQPTGWTKEDPSYNCYSESNLHTLAQGGWTGYNYAPYTDYVCVDTWQYMNGQGDAGIVSPELDLSKDGGNIKVNLTLCAELAIIGYDENWQPLGSDYASCAVALFTYDETVGDFVQQELHYLDNLTFDWQDREVNLTKGAERSIIGIYGVKVPGNLYIDNLKITQNYKAGDMLRDPFLFARYHEGTSIEVTIPERASGMDIWHKVCAVKGYEAGNDGMNATYAFAYSDYTELALVGKAPNLSAVSLQEVGKGAFANVRNGKLFVANPEAEAVAVYDIAGNLLYTNAGNTTVEVELPATGVYVVKVGNKAIKVVR